MKTILLLFRKLKKSSISTSLGLLGLIVGLICTMYIFFWISNEISYNRFHEKINRIVVVHSTIKDGDKEINFEGCPAAVAPAIASEYPEIENSCRYAFPNNMLISYQNKQNFLDVTFADYSLLDVFSFPLIKGDQGEDGASNKIILTQTMANTIFGDKNPIGETVSLSEQKNFTVVGVIEDIPSNSSIQFDAMVPLINMEWAFQMEDMENSWYNNAFRTYILLNNASSFKKVSQGIVNRIQQEDAESVNLLHTYWFKDKYLYQLGHIRKVKIFALIGLLVLITAILNYINLTTTQIAKQTKEAGVRKTLGASKYAIIRRVYSEIALISAMAFALAILIALAGLHDFNELAQTKISTSALFRPLPLLALAAIYLLVVTLSGLYPSFTLTKHQPAQTLKANFTTSVKGNIIFRNTMVLTILTISIILLSATYIISKQITYLQKQDAGYSKDQLMYINLNEELSTQISSLKNEVLQIPGVYAASASSHIPVEIYWNANGFEWDGMPDNINPLITTWYADEDLQKTLNSKMLEGSFFSPGTENIVINKAFADLINWDSFAGRSISDGDTTVMIQGVMNNIEFNNIARPSEPMMIIPITTEDTYYLLVRFNPQLLPQVIERAQNICSELTPNYPFNYGFVADDFKRLTASEETLETQVMVFAGFSVVVLFLGLLGVIIFIGQQKTKEIGIRKCMGEEVSSLVFRYTKPFVILSFIAFIIATAISWYSMQRWLEMYHQRIHLQAGFFVLPFACIFIITIITVSWQSWRAATRNPVKSLRYE